MLGFPVKRAKCNVFIVSFSNDVAVSEPLDDGSVDGDSVASESSSDASKSPEEGDKVIIPPPLDLSKPWVDISILEFDDPSLFMVRTRHTILTSAILLF